MINTDNIKIYEDDIKKLKDSIKLYEDNIRTIENNIKLINEKINNNCNIKLVNLKQPTNEIIYEQYL